MAKETPPTIASPCVKNCCLNEDDICLGCFRSMDEICNWSQADDQTRRAILANANQRQRDHDARRRLSNGLTSIKPTTDK